jgi:hypothetical protein
MLKLSNFYGFENQPALESSKRRAHQHGRITVDGREKQ